MQPLLPQCIIYRTCVFGRTIKGRRGRRGVSGTDLQKALPIQVIYFLGWVVGPWVFDFTIFYKMSIHYIYKNDVFKILNIFSQLKVCFDLGRHVSTDLHDCIPFSHFWLLLFNVFLCVVCCSLQVLESRFQICLLFLILKAVFLFSPLIFASASFLTASFLFSF